MVTVLCSNTSMQVLHLMLLLLLGQVTRFETTVFQYVTYASVAHMLPPMRFSSM
jgi:hypothetical protein